MNKASYRNPRKYSYPRRTKNLAPATRSRVHGSRPDLDQCLRAAFPCPPPYVAFCRKVLIRIDMFENRRKNDKT